MNVEQFGLFNNTLIEKTNVEIAERAERAAVELVERSEKNDKVERNRMVALQIKATTPCSGVTSMAVREWIQDIELTRPYFAPHLTEPHLSVAKNIDTLAVCGATLQGPMRRCYERFMDAQDNRKNVTWQMVKTHLSQAYLTADEQEYLKSALEKTRQRAEETNGSYGRRYVEAAAYAYPATDRNDAIELILLHGYIKGLRLDALKRRLVQEAEPDTVTAAILAVERYTVQEERMKRLADKEFDPRAPEPMEVGEISKSAMTTPPQTLTLNAMQRSIEGLHKELTKLKGNTLYVADPVVPAIPQTPRKSYARAATPFVSLPEAILPLRPRRPMPVNPMGGPSYTPDRQPICHECQQVGHIGKACEIRRARLANLSDNRARQQNDNSGN